jgi:hypothetical protein
MKKGVVTCIITSILISNPFSIHIEAPQETAIKGKISPIEASETALIIRDRDTLKTPVVWGNFSQQVKPGTYKLIVSAKPPFKNAALGNLDVKRNHVLDVGELMLQKYH